MLHLALHPFFPKDGIGRLAFGHEVENVGDEGFRARVEGAQFAHRLAVDEDEAEDVEEAINDCKAIIDRCNSDKRFMHTQIRFSVILRALQITT